MKATWIVTWQYPPKNLTTPNNVKVLKIVLAFQQQKGPLFFILAIHSLMRNLQSMWFWVPVDGTTSQWT